MSAPEIAIAIGPEAVDRLAGYAELERWKQALVVMDVNTLEAVGERAASALRAAGVRTREHVFGARTGLPAGPEESAAVAAAARAERPVLVAAGSGVITDIVRHAAYGSDLTWVSVPSAASMDGYASPVAAMEIGGFKVTLPGRLPAAIFADPRVAAAAPAEMTRAGLGDLLGKATARVDWLAAHLLYGEPFSESAAAMVREPLTFAADHVEEVLGGGEEAVGKLLTGLVQSGLAMAVAASSRPASGCEHHASHFWDLLAGRGRRRHAPHGLQVGYATGFGMRLQRFAFGGALARLAAPTPVADPLGPAARRWLGQPSPELEELVGVRERFAANLEVWPPDDAAWESVRAGLAPSLGLFESVEHALTLAGIPREPGYLGIDRPALEAALRYGGRLRSRYTVVDFLEGQRQLDRALDTMFEAPAEGL